MLSNKRQRTQTPEEEYHHQNRSEEALRMVEALEQEMYTKDMENVAMKEVLEAREGDKDEDMAKEDEENIENDVDGQYSFDNLDSIPNYQMRNDDNGMRLFDELDKLCGFPSEEVDEDGGSEEFVDAENTQRLINELDNLFDCLVSNEQVEEAGDHLHAEDAEDDQDADDFADALDSFNSMDVFIGYKRENVELEVAKDPQPSLDIDIFLRNLEKIASDKKQHPKKHTRRTTNIYTHNDQQTIKNMYPPSDVRINNISLADSIRFNQVRVVLFVSRTR